MGTHCEVDTTSVLKQFMISSTKQISAVRKQ